jgi:hypothetical protein
MVQGKLMKLFQSNTGSIVISIILGLGLAALFRKACNDNKCIVIKGPNLEETQKYFYKINDDCWQYKPVFAECTNAL